jgi:hypothetical protein
MPTASSTSHLNAKREAVLGGGGAGVKGLGIGDVLREKITYGSLFVVIPDSLVRA